MSGRDISTGSSTELAGVARGGAFALVGAVVSAMFGFLLVVVVTRGLHTSGAGVFFTAVAMFTILSNTAKLGADTGLVRMVSRYRALARARDVRATVVIGLGPVLAVGTALALAVFVLAPQLAELFMRGADPRDGTVYLRGLAPFLPLGASMIVMLAGTRGHGSVVPYVVVNSIGTPVARVVLVLGAVAAGLGGMAVTLAWALPLAAGFVVGLAVLAAQVRRGERESPPAASPQSTGALAAEFWRFAAPRGVAAVFEITLLWVNVLLLGALASTHQAGIYAAASKFVTTGVFVLEATRLAIAPQISALLTQRRTAEAEHLLRMSTTWVIAASWPIYLSLAAFAPVALRMYGGDFVTGQTALTILSLAVLVNLGTGNIQTVLLMGGKSSWNLFNMAGAVLINVVLGLLLIPRYGIEGAAIAWSVAMMFDNVASIIEVRLLLGLRAVGRDNLRVAIGTVACFAVLGAAMRLGLGPTLPALIGFGLVAGGVYVLALWRFRELVALPVLSDALRSRARRGQAKTVPAVQVPGAAEALRR
jgi:O-antigen/teichoic acid export membrane protein